MTRPSFAHIDLAALRANYRLAVELSRASRATARCVAVVKANAYGHGAVEVARALDDTAPALAVSCCDEGLVLRQAGITSPILLLEGLFSDDEIALCAHHDFWPMLENPGQVDAVVKSKPEKPLTIWLKVDTGMHRLGLLPHQFKEQYQRLLASDNVAAPVVVGSHFASADELDNPFTRTQVDRLHDLVAPVGAPLSMANSPGLLAWPEARADWNRPGFMLYGASPFDRPHAEADRLRPVMQFESRVISLRWLDPGETVGYGQTWKAGRRSLIATVPVGYGDGYPRTAGNGTPVLVKGARALLAGRVSMDLITVDVTDVAGIQPGAPVELWGASLSVNEVARSAGTSAYELLTRMPARLTRLYRGGA